MTITIFVKPTATGDKITLTDIDEEMLVSDLKDAIAQHSPILAAEQRVIYKGQILKNERTVASYGIGNEHVLHLVKGKSESSSPNSAPVSAPVAPGPQHLMGMDPSMMSDMLNNPMFQSILSNPELMRTMLSNTPGFREVMDRNPEIAQALNNPAHLRQMLETMRNPSLMAEQMRQTDRQLSNIEAMPEGFNRLRQMFESVQEPLMNASSNASGGEGGAAANPLLAALLGGGAGLPNATNTATGTTTSGTLGGDAAPVNPNANPLPNPWASSGTGSTPGATGLGSLGGLGGMAGLGGLGGGLPPGMNMESMMQMMQNPAMQSMMRSISSNPALLQQMIQSNPMMRNAPPQVRDMMADVMSNPQQLQSLFEPSNIQAMLQLQSAMRQLQSTGLMGSSSPGSGLGGEVGGMQGMDFASLLSQMGGAGGMAPLVPPPVADPEVTYAAQLQQLQDMGFYDRATNISALQATGGNVNAAVERLLSQ
jgi:ubiquilin